MERPPETTPEGRQIDVSAARLRGFEAPGLLATLAVLAGSVLYLPLGALLALLWAERARLPWSALGLVQPRSWVRTVAIAAPAGMAFKLLLKAVVMPVLGAGAHNQAYAFLVHNPAALPGMLVTVLLSAGFAEEVVFRGFLFRGLAKPGWEVHAIGGIALAWALLHIQYDWLGTAQVFLIGLMLGWFRWASGSTLLTIGMHVLINLESMIETWIKVEYFS
jgi:membrane protease YdiL (CAAX protease family)